MTELQKEFEATGYTSWINLDLYPNGKIYTNEYVEWLEKRVNTNQQNELLLSAYKEGFQAAVDALTGANEVVKNKTLNDIMEK